MSQGSRAATPKSKIVWVRNNNLSKKQLSEQETRTAAHFESISKLLTWFVRLLLFFPVRFRLNSFSADLTFDFRRETIIFSWLPWREPHDLTRPGQRPGEFCVRARTVSCLRQYEDMLLKIGLSSPWGDPAAKYWDPSSFGWGSASRNPCSIAIWARNKNSCSFRVYF